MNKQKLQRLNSNLRELRGELKLRLDKAPHGKLKRHLQKVHDAVALASSTIAAVNLIGYNKIQGMPKILQQTKDFLGDLTTSQLDAEQQVRKERLQKLISKY